MPFAVGIILSLGVALFARRIGLDRDRAFYSTVLIVVASYYVLFAAMGGPGSALLVESLLAIGFVAIAVAGFTTSRWIIVAGLAGHGMFDAVHAGIIENAGMPAWWPAFCAAYDIGAATWLAWLLALSRRPGRAQSDFAQLAARMEGR